MARGKLVNVPAPSGNTERCEVTTERISNGYLITKREYPKQSPRGMYKPPKETKTFSPTPLRITTGRGGR